MEPVYAFEEGASPLLVSVPHDGRLIPDDIRARMTPAGLGIPDTDWHVATLYDFAGALGASTIVANYSRYVVDLNRPASDDTLYPGQVVTGLCPEESFAGSPLYRGAGVEHAEKTARVERYWKPYHDRIRETLAAIRERFGYALLWDAHSIPSRVPRLFGGKLPVLNIGTYDGRSAAKQLADAVLDVARASDYETVINARFKGGHITRHYGEPANDVHAIQLEIAQRAYMSEASGAYDTTNAALLRATLTAMLGAFLDSANERYR